MNLSCISAGLPHKSHPHIYPQENPYIQMQQEHNYKTPKIYRQKRDRIKPNPAGIGGSRLVCAERLDMSGLVWYEN